VSSARASTFGPSALATPANAVTLARLLAAPVIMIMVALWGPSWVAFAVAFAVAATDGLDGWIARRQGTTRSGAFLDPLADKAVVVGTLFVLAAQGRVPWLPVALITGREVLMQVYRSVLGRRGISVPARASAKIKTLVQDLAVGLCLIPQLSSHHAVTNTVLWAATVLTLFTGAQYLMDGRSAARARRQAAPAGGLVDRSIAMKHNASGTAAAGGTGTGVTS
jgi:CDP-diacylglycerol---glycerol-3-phosphate 3-phosphatidyltransferase